MTYTYPHHKDEYTIGVISDTHGLLRPEAIKALHGSDLILHAGDIGDPAIIKKLEEISPVMAVRGNVDTTPSLYKFPFDQTIIIDNFLIYIIHNIGDLNFKPEDKGINIVVYGHSHKASMDTKSNVIYFNPGSAGKKRFHFPLGTGEIKISKGMINARLKPFEFQ